ncbi:MAG: ribulose-phosphate 3-epimerase [bacterium]|nr:ribulose-phosphate 3-epimerase [bacterium]
MNDLIISASVLSADFLHLETDLRNVAAAGSDWLHLDIMDGHFVPNLSFGMPLIKAMGKLNLCPLDVHLMVSDPDMYLPACQEAGAKLVTAHVEACAHLHRFLGKCRQMGMQAGVAMNPSTSPEFLPYIAETVDFVLIMSVNPGFSGQRFIPSALDKIQRVRELMPSAVRIGVDGGVNEQWAPRCREAGADTLIAASAIFGSDDYSAAIARLRV